MSKYPALAYWRGQNIDDMSREDLIKALKLAGRMLHEHVFSESARRAHVLGQVEMLKRGEA